jgi:ABC-2 type transport system permease protein
LARTSRDALVALVGIWLLGAVVVPRVLTEFAERSYPTPNGTQFWAAIQEDLDKGIDGHAPASERTELLKKQVLAKYGVDRVEDLPVNFGGLALQAGEEHGNRVFDEHYQRLWRLLDRQDQIRALAGLVTPRALVQQISMGLCGTDSHEHRHFTTAAETYRRKVNKLMNESLAYRSTGATIFQGDREFWSSAPDFLYVPRRLTEVMRPLVWPMAGVALWTLGLGACTVWAGRRLRP